MRPLALSLLLLLPGARVWAQSRTAAGGTKAITGAAASITEADVARRIRIIADDSMGGRDTPSRGLDLTARYVANEFKRLGLKPGGDNGDYLQEYEVAHTRIVPNASTLTFANGGGPSATVSFATDARLLRGAPGGTISAPLVLVGGPLDSLAAHGAELKGKTVVWVAQWNGSSPNLSRNVVAILREDPAAVVLMVNNDSTFVRFGAMQDRGTLSVGGAAGGGIPIVAVRDAAIVGQLPEAAAELEQFRAASTLAIEAPADWTGTLKTEREVMDSFKAPNTVGILEGSDPTLRHEYLIYSAHMDHIGTAGVGSGQCRPAGTDTICNGADDDGSGTVGIMELAEAFAQPNARPKRSIIFLTVSGEEKGLWGSQYFADHPPVPLQSIVADLNIDMIGRNWKDTIVVIGKEHSDLGRTMNEVNRQHPELDMSAIDDRWPEESFYTRSDHFNFARKGVPVLFFFNGVHADYHRATDSPDKLDAEKEARILKLLFYLGQEVGNRAERPVWNPESYQKIVEQKAMP